MRAYDVSGIKSFHQIVAFEKYRLGDLEIRDQYFKTSEKLNKRFTSWLKDIQELILLLQV